jgi:hypothetical protein
VKLRWKILQLSVIAGLTILATGCGGFHAKYGVSPLSFLLPGLVKVDAKHSKPANPVNQFLIDDRSKELAQIQNSHINF